MTLLMVLLVALAVLTATCGVLASVVVRRHKRRARGFFVVGFLCGFTAATVRRNRSHTHTLRLAARTLPLVRSPSRRSPRRQRIRG